MIVLKFGGTSVGSAQSLTLVKDIISSYNGSVIIVVSAFGGVTNSLIDCSEKAEAEDDYLPILREIEKKHLEIIKKLISVHHQAKTLSKVKIHLNELEELLRGIFLIGELSPKTRDKILSYGERLSSIILTDILNQQAAAYKLADAREFIITDTEYGKANVHYNLTNQKISEYFKEEGRWICPGFIGTSSEGNISTLGRGGSDYTASILAAALKAERLEIWTDVSGMMTANPNFVKHAYPLERLNYEEAMELSHFGAKVIYPPTIQPALAGNIPIFIKNTFKKDDPGTIIKNEEFDDNQLIKGISTIENVALLNITGSGMVGIPNISYRLFKSISGAKVNVILITQASSEHSICICIDSADTDKAKKAIKQEFEQELVKQTIDPVEAEQNLAIIALVGSKMREQVGVSGKMFSVLGNNGINVKAIAQGSSERNISVVIDGRDVKKTLNTLHESFFLSERKQLNLFVIGSGNVGSVFLKQLKSQKKHLAKNHHLDIRVVGLANSRKMIFNEEGLDLNKWQDNLNSSNEKMELAAYIKQMTSMNLRNSIFIDNTAEDKIAESYYDVLRKSISVVTPNKVACTQSQSEYQSLKQTALNYRVKFLFETNVGAGLPIINTLNDLIKSGDEILKIEAVLSGSLNFIFNNFNSKTRFSDIVRQAKDEGYTEPDPRLDLSGKDVMRKILILIRESGFTLELNEIASKPFVPEECMNADSVEKFFSLLEKHEDHFQQIFKNAEDKNYKLKYVASYNQGKAQTGLKNIAPDHPFYNLEGKDNIVLFTTKRYSDQPLVIKGAGAGAEVTAMGIFADVMRIANE